MINKDIIFINILSGLILLLTGCHRRDLDYDYYSGVPVRVNIDWSNSPYIAEHIRLVLFSETGQDILSYYIEPSGSNISIPYGDYHAVLYNWRSNEELQYIRFAGEDTYAGMNAYTDYITRNLFTSDVLVQPDNLVCWSSGNEIISITKGKPCCEDVYYVIETKPVSLNCVYDFFIPATGLAFVKGGEAVLSGIARGINLSDSKTGEESYLMSVSMVPTEEGIKFRFTAFGLAPGASHILNIKFRLIDGSDFEFIYDMTDLIFPCRVQDIDTRIEIPDVSGTEGGFLDPEIGNWEDWNDDIVF